jgi:hypothetical protein
MPRELPRQLSTPNGQFLPSPTLHALIYVKPSTRGHHTYHATRQKIMLKFATCISKHEAMKCFLNPMTNTTANKSKALFRAELKGISGALQIIAYRRLSGRTALQCIMLQSHSMY